MLLYISQSQASHLDDDNEDFSVLNKFFMLTNDIDIVCIFHVVHVYESSELMQLCTMTYFLPIINRFQLAEYSEVCFNSKPTNNSKRTNRKERAFKII